MRRPAFLFIIVFTTLCLTVGSALAQEKVDIRALSVMETDGPSVLRFVTNDLDEPQTFTPVLSAVPGQNFNALWDQVHIQFNPGVTPHQFTSEADILAAAQAGQITLINTGEVYRDSVVGGGQNA